MTNVLEFASYRLAKSPVALMIAESVGTAAVVPFVRKHALAEHNELTALNRALAALDTADELGDKPGAAEWRDELDVLALHTDSNDVRSRCKAAIRTSEKRAYRRLQ